MRLPFFAMLILPAFFVFTGCDHDGVKVYQVTEEQSSATPPSATVPPVQSENSAPQLQFAVPSGWQQIAPSQMRVASFSVTNADGQTADVAVIPLPAGENELALVNMWRDQMQLPALTNTTTVETVPVGGDSAKYFEITSEQPLIEGKFRARILIAELTRGNLSWFFKMTGADSLVAAQKDNFIKFLKSVSFVENTPVSTIAAMAPQTDSANNINSMWAIPASWKSVPPSSAFLLAQFSIVGENGANAEVNVAELAGEGGGLAMNVNRWRGQLGLPPVSDILASPLSLTDSSGGQIVDFSGTNVKTGKPTRLVGAVVPQNGQTWFYKLMGDDAVVAQQKAAFIQFIQSAQYPK